jgi:hypothetical protein
MRDMSEKQFLAALANHGMHLEGFMGYVRLNVPSQYICVSMFNAGPKLRQKLAYLLREQDRHIAEAEAMRQSKDPVSA